jgi:hypothetical protein
MGSLHASLSFDPCLNSVLSLESLGTQLLLPVSCLNPSSMDEGSNECLSDTNNAQVVATRWRRDIMAEFMSLLSLLITHVNESSLDGVPRN